MKHARILSGSLALYLMDPSVPAASPATTHTSATTLSCPDEVATISVGGPAKDTISWNAAPQATFYDLVRGRLSGLPVGPGAGDETCFGGRTGTSTTDIEVPGTGHGFWYDVRAVNACGPGPYGSATSGPRVTTTCGTSIGYYRDERDAGNNPFLGGCHYDYSEITCTNMKTLYSTDYCESPELLAEWTDNVNCHGHGLDLVLHNCDVLCIGMGFASGRCSYGVDPPCPPGVPTATCRCF